MTDADESWSYAPPGTLLGAIERGRGLGYAHALAERGAGAEAVLDCLCRDTRWDWGVDERAGYHACLVRELGLPLAPLLEQLDGPDEDGSERAREVLAELALLGSAPARAALRRYVRDGEWWQEVLAVLVRRWPRPWWDDLGPDAVRRLAGAPPLYWRDEPWRWVWRELLPARERPPRAPHRLRIAPRTDRLLAVLADPGSARDERSGALDALAGRPAVPPGLLALVPELSAPAPVGPGEFALPGVHRAVHRLGPLAVEPARAWAADGPDWLRWLGATVLAEHGGTRDLPLLVAELARQEAAGEWCGPMALADGLARFGPAAGAAVPLLRRLWRRTPHSYERPSYLRALDAIDPGAALLLLVESLWDCEPDARHHAVRRAPGGGRLADRLAELRDSPLESAGLRADAARRLAG
ncbi:hypothetical protein ACWEO1_31115 [Kitasatospora cineracea]